MDRERILRKKAALDYTASVLESAGFGLLARFLRWNYRRWCKREIQQYITVYVSMYGFYPTPEWLSTFLRKTGHEYLIDGIVNY